MTNFADLFKDKYKSAFLRDELVKLIRKMSDLKHTQYHEKLKIVHRQKEIDAIEEELKELGIEIDENFDPEEGYY